METNKEVYSMDTWRLIPLETCSAAMNMAIDEAILNARIADQVPNTLRLYRWQPSAVSVGRNQKVENEVYLDTAKKLGVDVVRRISGGGAVFHDFEGEVTYSVIAKSCGLGNSDLTSIYNRIYSAINDGLRILGFLGDFSSGDTKNCPNLNVKGKKISGSSQTITRGVVLQHGTVLVSVDLPKMFQLLKLKDVDCSVAANIGKRKITAIQNELGHKVSHNTVANALANGFKAILKIQLEEGELTVGEKENAHKLCKEKYSTKEWNLGEKN
jgi:lipoate---protein ligase